MLDLQRGQKISIQTVCRTWTLEVELRHQGPLAVDVSCFGLDSAGRLSDERYFLFYNQRRSPEGAMALSEGASGGTARFQVDLAALPDHIQRLSFTAAIDGGRTLRELEQGSIGLWVRGEEMARYAYAAHRPDTPRSRNWQPVCLASSWAASACTTSTWATPARPWHSCC